MWKVLGRVFPKLRSRRLLVPSRQRQGEAKIAVRRVGHRYDNDVVALRNVNINIHHGEFVCLLGPSGCGKSTLLHALAGQFVPSGGRITIDGKEVEGPSPERVLMYQEPALFPWLNVRANLRLALRARCRDPNERAARAEEFIRLVGLEHFEETLPHQLSGGMRMRVSLARALAMDPAVLLMDEPFGALDAQTRGNMHQLLQSIWMRSRKTVVFVTHDVREALVLGDRVVVMAARPGRVLQDLEVRLPRPRDPDEERLVHLSRKIRAALEEAEAAGEVVEEGARRERGTDRPAAGALRPGADHPLGAGG